MPRSPSGLKVTLLIPLKDNEGEPFDLWTWSWWSGALMELVSGFTDLGVATGWWRGFTDENRVIVVVVRSLREVDAIRSLLREARVRFRQEAMYLEFHRVFFEEVR
ncbi:MAG TPA: hypothetical protein VEU30_16415 [Thermoanaerobaculia bacterium]|nr:hypothetical protein [Thermoanaerobaculia bacterium]